MPYPKKTSSHKPVAAELINSAYIFLYKIYGPQGWWPAKTPFEVCVGAILTQNTNWSNVEKAITNLKKRQILTPAGIRKVSIKTLAKAIMPCGYYNIKAARLKNFISFIFSRYKGRIENMSAKQIPDLRDELLSINGIGPETCDSILLYGLNKPVFVVDAYTRRMTECLKLSLEDDHYNSIQSLFMNSLPRDSRLFNEYHALIVRHAKNVCRKKPECVRCVLRSLKNM
jgi:endonuclease III related protein